MNCRNIPYVHESQAAPSMKLHSDLGVTQKTAWKMGQKIHESSIEGDVELMSGSVEVDEANFSGL